MEEKYYKLNELPIDKIYFWSYDKEKAEMPLSSIIEPIIKKGELKDLYALFNIFPLEELKASYFNKIRTILSNEDKQYYKLRPKALPDMQTVFIMDTLFQAAEEINKKGELCGRNKPKRY